MLQHGIASTKSRLFFAFLGAMLVSVNGSSVHAAAPDPQLMKMLNSLTIDQIKAIYTLSNQAKTIAEQAESSAQQANSTVAKTNQLASEAKEKAQQATVIANNLVCTVRDTASSVAKEAAADAADKIQNRLETLVNNASYYAREAEKEKDASSAHTTAANRYATEAKTALGQVNDMLNQGKKDVSLMLDQHGKAIRTQLNTQNDAISKQLKQNLKHAEADRKRDHEDHLRKVAALDQDLKQWTIARESTLKKEFEEAVIRQTENAERARQKLVDEHFEIEKTKKLKLKEQKLALERKSKVDEETALADIRRKQAVDVAIHVERERLQALKDDKGLRELKLNEEKMKADAQVELERIRGEYNVQQEDTKWTGIIKLTDKISSIVSDPQKMGVLVGAAVLTGAGIYAAKSGMPVVISYLVQPRVVSETSKVSWFGWTAPKQDLSIANLMFEPALQAQLNDLALQVQTAKQYDENLPNVMFHGAPGTGKTAFAKALAQASGLEYALTSGSEFAKITDLNLANKELRKLLEWAQNSEKGLIVFIDEAESLFANRKLPTTSKNVQDFINTFLALVPEKSQKNMMFIFATNHPFKLDDAITNRVGVSIEFQLPEADIREKILVMYLEQFAAKNKNAVVELTQEISDHLKDYAVELEGLAPRAIKFVAEQMIVRARRQADPKLTHDIAQVVLCEAKLSVEQTNQWTAQREKWVQAQTSHAAAAA